MRECDRSLFESLRKVKSRISGAIRRFERCGFFTLPKTFGWGLIRGADGLLLIGTQLGESLRQQLLEIF
jgi:hypothetical protein